MKFIRLIIIVIIIVFFAIIYTQNLDVFTQEFTLKMDLNQYMVGPYVTKNIVLILSAFVLGVVVALIFGALQALTASADSRQKSRRIKELEAKITDLTMESKSTASAQPSPLEESSAEEKSDSSSNPFSPPSS